jgi:hypothetical protein
MDSFKLQINAKTFNLVFGLKVFRILGRKWNCPNMETVAGKLAVLDGEGNEFDQMDILEDLLVAAIEAGNNPDFNPEEDDIIHAFYSDPQALEKLTAQIIASMPRQQPQEPGKLQAVPKKAIKK